MIGLGNFIDSFIQGIEAGKRATYLNDSEKAYLIVVLREETGKVKSIKELKDGIYSYGYFAPPEFSKISNELQETWISGIFSKRNIIVAVSLLVAIAAVVAYFRFR